MLAVVSLLYPVGCSSPADRGSAEDLAGLVGRTCVVQFRRDALGAAADLPISPDTTSLNGASTTIQGRLASVRGDWLHLDIAIEYRSGDDSPPRAIHRNVYIPVAAVLYVEPQ